MNDLVRERFVPEIRTLSVQQMCSCVKSFIHAYAQPFDLLCGTAGNAESVARHPATAPPISLLSQQRSR